MSVNCVVASDFFSVSHFRKTNQLLDDVCVGNNFGQGDSILVMFVLISSDHASYLKKIAQNPIKDTFTVWS